MNLAFLRNVENKGPVAENIRSLLKNQGFVVNVVAVGVGLPSPVSIRLSLGFFL